MAQLKRHTEHKGVVATGGEEVDVFGAIDRTFERMFGPWSMPLRRPVMAARHWMSEAFLPLDEFHRDGELVIRAELPGIDPEKDVKVTVTDGMLHISAERRSDERVDEEQYVRRELHYGSFERVLPLPPGTTEAEVKASYVDGILEIAVPAPEARGVSRIPITTK